MQAEEHSYRHLVGIGASAGGLEALEKLFRNLPAETGMAFVVVQHLSPDFKSQMSDLLSRWTTTKVRLAEHEMPIERDTIYLMPSKSELIVADGRLLLKARSEGLALPIDQFLRSAAAEAGDRCVGVILSGTGSDGSRGVVDVHEAGGLVIVQSDTSAKFDGMPRSAVETGVVDLVLHPAEIPAALVEHAARVDRIPDAGEGADHLESVREGGMRAVFAMLRERYGIDFSAYKAGTISRRTERRLLLNRTGTLGEYVERLRSDRDELDALYCDLLIGVTEFFRDREAFELLEGRLIPELIDELDGGDELRLWVAGCATGEEAYSIAMLLVEAFERRGEPLRAKIFATDVHRPSLEIAGAGVYDEAQLEKMSPARRARFFTQDEHGRCRVTPLLRRMIVFAPHDVIRDAPFTKLDLVSCRNLLIYLQPAVQRKALSLFHFGLRTGGVLMLGPSETPGDLDDEFATVDAHWKIYRKRRDVRLFPGMRGSLVSGLADRWRDRSAQSPLLELFSSLLDTTLPPSVLLDQHHQVVHSFGDISPLLRLPRGRPSLSLLDMLDGDLRLAVAGALHRAARGGSTLSFSEVRAPEGFSESHVNINVRPLTLPRGNDTYFLVSLQPVARPARTIETSEELKLDEASRDRMRALEEELLHTKENLQATIEELEASNEELQATNEEMLASNEELQSTNEELHSVNEELYTVNAEFQRKIDELTELTDDMDNLLLSTEVHTLFLDERLCIRKFTPAMADLFNLIERDIGRRIDSFVHSIRYDGLTELLQRTLDTGARFETEVSTGGDASFLMRALPYRGTGPRGGVVLTLTDITELRSVEDALRKQVRARDEFLAMLSHELRNPLAAVNNAVALLGRRAVDDAALDVIASQSRHMQRLLDDLLDVARVTQGKITLRFELIDMRALVEEVVALLDVPTQRAVRSVALDLPADPLWVRGDRARLVQVVENLLTNAIKYTASDGRVAVRLAVDETRDELCLAVEDDGVGISATALQHIFEMFMQDATTIDRSQGGLGVGLTLTRNLVSLHDGSISAHSPGPGKGSRFEVRLPRAAPPVESHTRHPEPAPMPAPDERVHARLVIVEDRAEIRETLAELLREEGFEVVTAEDGEAGLRKILESRPRAALLDVGLPGLDGYELARRVRAEPKTASTPLLALTGYGSAGDVERARAAGFDEHLTKPVDIDDVLASLGRLGVS